MDDNNVTDLSEYHQVPLSNLLLPDHYSKLIKRIKNLNSTMESLDVETVADILKLEPHDFSNIKGVGTRYVKTLIEFKKELSSLLTNQKQVQNSCLLEDIFTIYDNSYDPETLINQLDFSPKYQKLIKRILAVVDNVKTVQDVIDIDVAHFAKLPGVGKLYVELLIDLKNAFSSAKKDRIDSEKKLPNEIILSKLYLNYGFLTEVETKQLKKLESIYERKSDVNNVNIILNLDMINLSNRAGLGNLFLITLRELQKKIKNELLTLPENITEHIAKKRGLLVSSEIAFIEFTEIDSILIEDIEGYLWTLDEMKVDIAQSRWGFNQKHETLEEVGSRYTLTRERIRQYEKSINTGLKLNFRLQPKVLWVNIREKMVDDLTILLPNLAKCFEVDRLFYEFIEICCQVESGSIREIMMPRVNGRILDPIFCNTPSPIAQEIIVNDLMSNYGYSKAAAFQVIKQLEKNDKIKVSEQGIFPLKLGRVEAVAHALTFHPLGLPWKDITRIVNKKGFSLKQIDELRMTHGFSDNENIYLCGTGTYRNLMFLDIEQFDLPSIMSHLINYLKVRNINSLHLHDYFYESKNNIIDIEYFNLRHLVREYGEEYGLYFNGKSGTDSVSLDPDVSLISQADVIIKVLNESKAALTKQEIAERLKSKSTKHASFYLNKLIEEGHVVRVDQLVYTTTAKAFKDLDTQAIIKVIENIMHVDSAIIEADVFREHANRYLNLSYSKYIYIALLRSKIIELALYRSGSLFSKEAIPYKNLIDVCNKLCDPDLPNTENIEIIKKNIWLTDTVATRTIQNWKWQLNNKCML